MHQRKGKKIFIYFFLLLLVGSINNINLNNLKFGEIKNINVIGLEENEKLIFVKEIKNLDLKNIFQIKSEEIKNQINSNSLVEKFDIYKNYPSSLNINIKKTKFLARINKQGKIYLVGSNGKFSKNEFLNNQLPFIFGKPEINEFLNFKKIIDKSQFSFDKIKNLYFFSSKRWDIEFKNGLIVKLPENDIPATLSLVFEFLRNSDLKSIKIVDARIKSQIILND